MTHRPLPPPVPTPSADRIPAGELGSSDFQSRYFRPRRPVLLRQAATDWDFRRNWSRDYLCRELGDFRCTVARDSRPAYAKEQCSLRDYFRDHAHLSTMTFRDFDPNTAELPRLLQDIPLPNAYFTRADIRAYFFFHANAQGGSLPHCHQDAFNLLQRGVKRWALYDADPEIAPRGWEILKRCHQRFGQGSHARDWFIDGPERVRAEGVAVFECEQHAGDILYIPEHWSHAVLNRTENQGLVIITERADKPYQRDAGGGYSPNSPHARR